MTAGASSAAAPSPPNFPAGLWEDLLGLPYRDGARGPDAYDCWGLLRALHARAGLAVPDFPTPVAPDAVAPLEGAQRGFWQPLAEPLPGASLLFRDGALGRHAGVCLDGDRFVHASAGRGQVAVDRLSRLGWSRALLGAFRPRAWC